MLVIQETYVNETRGYLLGEPTEYYEPSTDNIGELFKSCRKEHGRCISRVYQDTPDGTADPIGWVFEKLCKYDDTGERFLQNVWVTYKWVKDN